MKLKEILTYDGRTRRVGDRVVCKFGGPGEIVGLVSASLIVVNLDTGETKTLDACYVEDPGPTLAEWNGQPGMVAFADLPKDLLNDVFTAQETIPMEELEAACRENLDRSEPPVCPNKSCQDYCASYALGKPRVYLLEGRGSWYAKDSRNGDWYCELCGGICQDGVWRWECRDCHSLVGAGNLTGLFVPHLCQTCHNAATERYRAAGNICRLCGHTRNNCCC